MPDPVQVFMENACHLTGYLHRLLFLMKELDKKEHNINKMIEEKEEIYLERLNDIHRKKSKKYMKFNDESNVESNDSNNECSIKNDVVGDILKSKKNDKYIDCENVNEKKDNERSILNYTANSNDFIKGKEQLKTEKYMNANDNLKKFSNSIKLEENKEKESLDTYPCDDHINLEDMKTKNSNQKETDDHYKNKKIIIKMDNKNVCCNDENKKKESKSDIKYNDENEKKENVSDILSKDNNEKKKREKRSNITNEENEDKISKKIKICDNISNTDDVNPKVQENHEEINSTKNKDYNISYNKLDKMNQHINSNDEEDENENENDSNKFNEEELNNYLNEIMNDREQCMALLREKICINNQISYMIKHDYEKLKKQYDKLYAEMEMTGESSPYLYNSFKNKNVPSELDDYNINIRSKNSYSNYHYGLYNIEKQKTEESEIFLNKGLNRKHLNKYNSEHNTYTDKIKKSKKVKKNKIENSNSNKSLKCLNDKNNNQKMRISLFSPQNNYNSKLNSLELNEACNKIEDKDKDYVNQVSVDSSFNISLTENNINKKINEKNQNDYSKGKNAIHFDSLSNYEKNQLQNIPLNCDEKKNAECNDIKQENNISSYCNIYLENGIEEEICPICNRGESASSEFGMVGCDSCNKWFHFECVNYENNDCNESWYCPKCISVE